MASGSQLMTTYYAKRIMGDNAATTSSTALLQSGVQASMWIFGHKRSNYGIKYLYDNNEGKDKIEFHGNAATATAWVQLNTGDISFGTVKSGTWNGSTIGVDYGGTGKTSWTPWGIVYANTSTTLSQVTAGASGNSGYLLQSNGAAAPGWIEATSSKVADTIVKRGNNGGFNAGAIVASLPAGTGDHFIARATGYTNNKNLDVKLMVATGKIYHGIYSTGYSTDGTAFVDDTKWMIYRDNEGTIIVNGNCTGNAATADTSTNAKYIYDWNYGSGAGETITGALQKFFDDGPNRSRATAVRLKCGSTYMGFGYFLNGNNYNTQATAYGGWFVAAYGTPHYVGISNGTWTDNVLIHSNNYTTYCTPANIGAAASDHTHNYAGSASAGGAANSALSQSYQHSTLDFSKSNFDISTAYERNLCWIGDKESRGLGRINFIANTDGTTQIKLQARAWKTADSAVGSFLGITVTGNRDNTVSYTVSSPANFRSAIGAGTGTITGITMNGASKGTSGVIDLGTVLTAHQDISGKANVSGDTFTGYVLLKNDDDAPRLHFTSNDTTGQSGGFISINMALTNNIRRPSRFAVRVYSYNSVSGIYDPNNYEQYRLPEVTADRTSYQNYLILTSKEAVTIAQGGTGKTTAAEAWTALGGGASGKHADNYYATAGHTHDYLPLSGGTITGQLILSNSNDAEGDAANNVPLIIGGAQTAAHIEIDKNEILAKSNGTTSATLYLQDKTGTVSVNGSGGLDVTATTASTSKTTGALRVSGGVGVAGTVYANAFNGPLTGNADTATQATRQGVSVGWHKGRDAVVAKTTTISSYSPTISVKTTNGSWEIGSYNKSNYEDKLIFSYVTDSDYNNDTNAHVDYTLTTTGNFSGNSATASALATAGTIKTDLESTSASTYTGGGNITPGISGTLGVGNGGTGASSFTADSVIVSGSTTTSALTTRTIINNTSAGALGWNSTKGTYIPTLNTLAYWNGAYSSTSSNIKYLGALEQHLQIRSAIVKGTAPDSATGRQIQVLESSSGTASESRVGQLYIYSDTSKVTHVRLYAFASSTTTSNNSYFGIACNAAATTKRTYTDCKVYGAVWNDYAEFRSGEITEGGYCVHECPDGKLRASVSRLEAGCRVTSDTFGFAIGETKECKTPIAVSGRALVYPYRNPIHYQLGAAVCSAPNGTVDIMSRDEIMKYPERIIGTVSEIPSYDTWYGGDSDTPVEVKGRIWIYVR